jgi:hypothetical protein
MKNDLNWICEDPTEIGWYVILRCFDPQEGVFLDTDYWDGHRFYGKGVSCYVEPPFSTKELAMETLDS